MVEDDLEVTPKHTERPNPSMQESLESEVIPDPMEGEQTWPTEEELAAAETNFHKTKKTVRRVPKGTSEYQASWIIESDEEEVTKNEQHGEETCLQGFGSGLTQTRL